MMLTIANPDTVDVSVVPLNFSVIANLRVAQWRGFRVVSHNSGLYLDGIRLEVRFLPPRLKDSAKLVDLTRVRHQTARLVRWFLEIALTEPLHSRSDQ